MENTDHGGGGIPGDVLIQILVWLPVISLLRFKSVCKSWRDLIESCFFIHLHATVTTSCSSSNRFGTFIFQTLPLYDTTETRIFMLTPPPPPSSRRRGGGGGGEVFEVEDLGFPPLYKSGGRTRWMLVGSCNGLICTVVMEDVSLWNPATRQFRILPKSSPLTLEERIRSSDTRNVFGFGFDVKTKDYKVLHIRPLYLVEKLVELRVQVYSLSTNSWRWLDLLEEEDINSLSAKSSGQGSSSSSSSSFNFERSYTGGLYLNGSFFFMVITSSNGIRNRNWILSFDFTKEIFTPIMFPDELVYPADPIKLILTYFGADKIALLEESSSSESREERRSYLVYDIWVLNNNNEHDHDHDQEKKQEEKKKSSYYWTKLQYSIPISTLYGGWIYPIAISDDGEFALVETRDPITISDDWKIIRPAADLKLQLFNLVTKEENPVFVFPTGSELQRADIYKPTLVSVIGGGGGGGNGNGTAGSSSS